jgi:hypothetical protein
MDSQKKLEKEMSPPPAKLAGSLMDVLDIKIRLLDDRFEIKLPD